MFLAGIGLLVAFCVIVIAGSVVITHSINNSLLCEFDPDCPVVAFGVSGIGLPREH